MPMMKTGSAKGWLIQSLAEFFGTAMFMYLAIGGADAVTQDLGPGTGLIGQALAFGIALLVTSWAFFRVSGAHFNPAISLSSLITGHISVPKFVLYFIAQILGAMLGIALARGTTPRIESIQQVNALNNYESIARGFFLEFFLTTILCFVYHMIVHEKNRSTYLMAIPYGLTLFSCHLFATRYTNAAINPARAFGTSVVARYFTREHWIYWFGPLAGAVLAAALHVLFRFVDYDHHSAGIDAANEAEYERAQAAYRDGNTGNNGAYTDDQYVNNTHGGAGTGTGGHHHGLGHHGANTANNANTTGNVLPR